MRKAVVAVVALAISGFVGCGERNIPERELLNAISRTERESREFQYREEVEYQPPLKETENQRARPEIVQQVNEVVGRIQDDLRYQVLYTSEGIQTAEGIVSDDALAVRILNVQAVLRNNRQAVERLGASGGDTQDQEAFDALLRGQWVLDYTAAPPLAAEVSKEGTLTIGNNPAQDAVYAFQYFRRSVEESATVIEFNPDAIEYNPADDPWSEDADADLRAKGIIRFDLVAPSLPRRNDQTGNRQQPGTVHFRKMAFYVRGGRVLKVAEKIDIQGQRDFRRILDQDRGSDYHRELLEQVQEGQTRDQVRERSMSYEIFNLGDDVTVDLPVNEAVVGTIGPLLGGETGDAITPFAAPRGVTPEPEAVSTPGGEESPAPDASPGTEGSPPPQAAAARRRPRI